MKDYLHRTKITPNYISLYLVVITLFTLYRLAFYLAHRIFFRSYDGFTILKSAGAGVVYDSLVISGGMLVIYLISGVIGWGKIGRFAVRQLLTFYLFLISLLTIFDITYFKIYDIRFNTLFIEQFDNIIPIFQSIWDNYPVMWLLPVIAVFYYFHHWLVLKLAMSKKFRFSPKIEMVITPIFLIVFSLIYTGHHLYRYRILSFEGKVLNQFVLNAPYSFFTDLYQGYKLKKKGIPNYYSFGSRAEGVLNFKSSHQKIDAPFIDQSSSKNIYRSVSYPVPVTGSPNVVIILMEGFSAVSIEALSPKGHRLGTSFEKLAKRGLFFTSIYGHGTRTHHGYVSTLAGYPSLLNQMLTRTSGNVSFYTLPQLLLDKGYDTSFIYSYNSKFDDKDLFAKRGGIGRILDLKSYKSPKFKSRWGVSDEDLYVKANSYFKKQHLEKKPFFSLLLNSVNHFPYTVPTHFYNEHPEFKKNGKSGYPATFAYADWALGDFLKNAEKEDYFKNTIFVVISDHGESVDKSDKFLKRLHIPMLVFAPELIKNPQEISKVGSQSDLIPTLLPFIGHEGAIPFIGQNLLDSDGRPGFAMMRVGDTAFYREKEKVLEWDMRSNHYRAFEIDKYSYLQEDKPLVPEELERLKKDAQSYMEVISQIFTKRQFRKPVL